MCWPFGKTTFSDMAALKRDGVERQAANVVTKLKQTGFFSIFGANVLSKILSFLGGIVIVRILSKGDYGLYAYVMNCYGMIFLFNDFGCGVAMMQYRSENHKNPTLYNDFFTFPFKCALGVSAISSILLLLSPMYYPFKQDEARLLTQSLFLLPFFSVINSFLNLNLRTEMQNNKFALLSFIQVILHYGFILPLSFFWNVWGAVLSNYAVAISLLLFGIFISRQNLQFEWKKCSLSFEQKKGILKYAFASQINNSIDVLMRLFDVFLIGLFIGDNEIISLYKVASVIPQALMFIPNSVLVYILPMFARNIDNITWVKRNFNRLILGCAGLNGVLAVLGICTASFLIPLIFGNQYADSVPCFVILMAAFFAQGTFQIPSANVIYTQHKVNVNVAITLASNVLNCILDIWLISVYGAIGAAMATLAVSIAASVMSYGYMKFWLRQQGA